MRTHQPAVAFDPLEARRLLAQSNPFTDSDGDLYTINLTGPGTFVATLSGGATGSLLNLTTAGTSVLSDISISVTTGAGGDGRVSIKNVSVGDLRKFLAPKLDVLPSAVIAFTRLSNLQLGDIGGQQFDTVNLTVTTATDADRLAIKLGQVTFFNMVIAPRITSFVSGSLAITNLTLTRGADTITSGAFSASIFTNASATFPVAIGTLSAASINLSSSSIAGAVGTLSSKTGVTGDLVNIQGAVGTFIAKNGSINFNQLQMHRVGTLSAPLGNIDTINLALKVPDLNGRSIGQIRALDVHTPIILSSGGTPGRIDKINVRSWTGTGTIIASTIGAINATGNLDIRLDVRGQDAQGRSVTSIKGVSIRLTSTVLPGGIGSIKGNRLIDSDLNCAFIGSVTLAPGGGFGGQIDNSLLTLTGVNAKGLSAGSIKAGLLLDTDLVCDGGIGSLIGTGFDVCDIEALFINTLKSTDANLGVEDAEFDLLGANAQGLSLKTVAFAGVYNSDSIDAAAGIGSVTCNGLTNGQLRAGFIRDLKVKRLGALTGEIRNFSVRALGVATDGLGIKSMTVDGLLHNGDGLQSFAGGVGSFKASQIDGYSFDALFITTFTIKPLAGFTGDARNCGISLTGADSQGFSLRTLTVAGTIESADVQCIGAIGNVTIADLKQSSLIAGSQSIGGTFDGSQVYAVDAGGINRVTLTRAFDVLNPVMLNSVIIGRFINQVSINGAIPLINSNPGQDFGIAARTFKPGTIKIRDTAGNPLIINSLPGAPGDLNPFAPAVSDFVIRVLV